MRPITIHPAAQSTSVTPIAMVEMSMSKEWREISVHRDAGLKGQLNIETVLQEGDWGPGVTLK